MLFTIGLTPRKRLRERERERYREGARERDEGSKSGR